MNSISQETAARIAADTMEKKSREKGARASISRLGIALFAYMVLPQIVAVLLDAFMPYVFPAFAASNSFIWFVQIFAQYVVGLSTFFLILGAKPLPDIPNARERFSFGRCFSCFSILMFCALVGSLISTVVIGILSFLRGAPIEDLTSELILSSPLIYIFLIVVVIGPIAEEIVYRHAVMRTLLPYGEKGAVLMSGLIFGMMHGNFSQLFHATAIGIVLSYLYARTGKLRHTILAHMLFNFFGGFLPALLMKYLPVDDLLTGTPGIEQIASYFLPLLAMLFYEFLYFGLAITGLVMFILRFRRARFYPAPCPLDRAAQARAYFVNVGMILFFSVCLVLLFISIL